MHLVMAHRLRFAHIRTERPRRPAGSFSVLYESGTVSADGLFLCPLKIKGNAFRIGMDLIFELLQTRELHLGTDERE